MIEVESCPECEGTNLNEEGTRCWNCDPEVE
jgi:ribosomal protein L37AE/L43A